MSRGIGKLQRQVLEVLTTGSVRSATPHWRFPMPTERDEVLATELDATRWAFHEGRPVYVVDGRTPVPNDARRFDDIVMRLGRPKFVTHGTLEHWVLMSEQLRRNETVLRALRSLWKRGLVAPVYQVGATAPLAPAAADNLFARLMRPTGVHWVVTPRGRREAASAAFA